MFYNCHISSTNGIECLSKTFSDTKRRAVSLRQLIILFCFAAAGHSSHRIKRVVGVLCRVVEFIMAGPDLGTPRTVYIWTDLRDRPPNWFVEKVVVEDLVTSRVYEFPSYRMFGTGKNDCTSSLRLSNSAGGLVLQVYFVCRSLCRSEANFSCSSASFCFPTSSSVLRIFISNCFIFFSC